jgi:hypothetical protein
LDAKSGKKSNLLCAPCYFAELPDLLDLIGGKESLRKNKHDASIGKDKEAVVFRLDLHYWPSELPVPVWTGDVQAALGQLRLGRSPLQTYGKSNEPTADKTKPQFRSTGRKHRMGS